jgi:hypothetical protein
VGNLFDREDREHFHFIVITGVIAKRTFLGHFIRFYDAFKHKLCRGWNL